MGLRIVIMQLVPDEWLLAGDTRADIRASLFLVYSVFFSKRIQVVSRWKCTTGIEKKETRVLVVSALESEGVDSFFFFFFFLLLERAYLEANCISNEGSTCGLNCAVGKKEGICASAYRVSCQWLCAKAHLRSMHRFRVSTHLCH